MRVALYARVSSEQQEQRGTVASQLDALRTYAVKHQMEICEEYVCVDDGYSGARLDRPALDRLRDGARLSAFDAVLVLCPDRLARKYAYQILIIEELERFGVAVHFLDNRRRRIPMRNSWCRCKVSSPNMNGPRSRNAIGAADSFGFGRAKHCSGACPMAIAVFRARGRSRHPSRSTRRPLCGCARSFGGMSRNICPPA